MYPLAVNFCSNLVYGESWEVSNSVSGVFTFFAMRSYLAVQRHGTGISRMKKLAGKFQPAYFIGSRYTCVNGCL